MIAFLLLFNLHADPARECAKNITEFRQSEKMKKILGADYDPFYKWESPQGAEILPDGKGSMYVKVPMLGRWLGYKDSPLPLEVCVEGDKPFAMREGRRIEFNDAKGNTLTLSDGKRSATFTRKIQGK